MRQQKQVTRHPNPERIFCAKGSLPGSVVEIDGQHYRVGRSGTWYKATPEEVNRERALRAASHVAARLA